MRRTVNVKPILGQGKRYNVNLKKKLKMIKAHGFLKQGTEYNIKGKLADSLLKTGKAIELKEEKAIIETKEEKFIGMSISTKNLAMVISGYTDEELLEIIKKDDRVTAKRIAEKEIQRREDNNNNNSL